MSEFETEIPTSPDSPDIDDSRRVRLSPGRRKPGSRIDKWLHNRLPRLSRTMLQRLIRDGAITVNGLPTKPSYEPEMDDVIDVLLPAPEPTDIIPEDIPLDILYEDDYLLALNKQTGIVCHPAHCAQTGTLVNGLVFYADSLSKGGDSFRPGIVHRLDKNTTGVLLVAKTDEAHWRLCLQFEKRTIHKTYLGVVEGIVDLDGDTIDQPLSSHPTVKDRFVVAPKSLRDMMHKHAVTRYKVTERFAGYTLVEMYPVTGRTHQLRVHMSYIGHPMMGDTLYRGHWVSERDLTGEGSTDPLMDFQSLHARRIEFVHPITQQRITIEAPVPAKLQRAIDLLRQYRPLKPRRSAGNGERS